MSMIDDQHLSSPYRGELRIFLGAAPGVGKTYAMLNEGHRLRGDGKDVVIGFVETHGRDDTVAQIRDLEIVPPRITEHGTLRMEEPDIDAILVRNPELVLIDELAHTNAPGSQRPKRFLDVEVLRDSGIDVLTTLNIQHVDELQDLVAGVTGITVRETVPNSILDSATEIQLVDLPIEVLLRRLEQGKIYPPARANQAMTSFFREGNLTALRELALRRTAEGVDDRLSRLMLGAQATGSSTERVLVLASSAPGWNLVIRNAWRLASALHGDLVTVHVVPNGITDPSADPELTRNLALARDLGAQVRSVTDRTGSLDDRIDAIAQVVEGERATILVGGVGLRQRRFGKASWSELTLLTGVLARCPGLDLHLVRVDLAT